MRENILALNAGSSSLKFAVFENLHLVLKGQVSGIGTASLFEASGTETRTLPEITTLPGAQGFLAEWLAHQGHEVKAFTGVGHRIVHGGTKYVTPIRVDDDLQIELEELQALAPLHQPFGLGVLRQMRRLAPGVPHIACFDTAFHATQPELATRLPIPREYHARGYRRYGFHGLNYEHVVAALPKITGKPLPRRLLVAHLGNGASMCAILDGRSIATTMGYSTADGLIMGTRTGSIDPGVSIALMRDENLDAAGLENLVYRRSGLLGLSGISSDMRVLLGSGKPEAKEAVAHYCYSAARHAGSLAVALGGLEAIAFTGGIGENAIPVRSAILAHLSWLNIPADQIFVVPANEELAIARHVEALLRPRPTERGH
jgi:acetate kinase